MDLRTVFTSIIGMLGAIITTLLGGWSQGMATLVIFMIVDYVTGLIVAGVFKKSKKSESGALESRAGFKGLCRKCLIFIFVIVAYRLDLMIGTDYIQDAVIIGFCVNELVSIVENAGLMGVPLPNIIVKAIDLLARESENRENYHGNERSDM